MSATHPHPQQMAQEQGQRPQRRGHVAMFAFFVVVVMVLCIPAACGPSQLSIDLYQGDPANQVKLSKLGSVVKPPLSLTAKDGTTELLSLDSPSVKLPQFSCKEWLGRAADEGTSLGLVPSLVFNGFVGDELTLSGRFPVDVACSKLKASILMAPVAQLSPWRPHKDERSDTGSPSWKRIGHHIVRLPDGRHWITGGMGSFSFSADGLPVLASPIKATFLYDPSTGALTSGPELQNSRAFHGAVVLGEQVILLGGLNESGKIAPHQGWRLSDLTPVPASDLPKEIKDLPPRAFQRVLKIEESGPGSSKSIKIVQIGGVSCGFDELSTSCKGDQLMYGQVVVMPKRQRVIVTGGVFFAKGFNEWRPLQEIHAFTFAELGTTFDLASASKKVPLSPARMAHVSVRQDSDRVWIFGGLVPPRDGSARVIASNRINAINLIEFDSEGQLQLKGLFVVGEDKALGRALASAIPLDKGRVLVVGGFLRVPANDTDKGDMAPNALVLEVDPADSSGSTLQVHTLAHTPRLWPTTYLLPTGQHWISGGMVPGAAATGPYGAHDAIQLYNPKPEGEIGKLVTFELLPTEPKPSEGQPDGTGEGQGEVGDGGDGPVKEGQQDTTPDQTQDGGTDGSPDAGESTRESDGPSEGSQEKGADAKE